MWNRGILQLADYIFLALLHYLSMGITVYAEEIRETDWGESGASLLLFGTWRKINWGGEFLLKISH
jgi:hypothetical protein